MTLPGSKEGKEWRGEECQSTHQQLIVCSICLIICLVIFSCIISIWGGLPVIQDNLKSKSFLWRSTTAKNMTAKFLKIITKSDICNWECMLFGAWSDKYNMSLLSTNCIEIKNFHMFVVFVRLKNFPKRLFYVRFEKFRRHKEINHVTLFFFFLYLPCYVSLENTKILQLWKKHLF